MNHDPDPRFLEHLEWQTERALRRKDRFARPVPTGALRVVRTLALVLACTLGGAGLVVAAEKIQGARRQELLLERNRIELALAEHRNTRASERVARIQMLHDSGRVTSLEVERARLEFDRVQRRADGLRLDRAEIEATGRTPDTEVTAPLARRRDVFSERVRLELEGVASRREIVARLVELAESRHEMGLSTAEEAWRQRAELEELEARAKGLEARLELRADWLLGRLARKEALRRDRLAAVEVERSRAGSQVALLTRELERARLLYEQGVLGDGQISTIEERLESAEAARQLAELERRLIEEGD